MTQFSEIRKIQFLDDEHIFGKYTHPIFGKHTPRSQIGRVRQKITNSDASSASIRPRGVIHFMYGKTGEFAAKPSSSLFIDLIDNRMCMSFIGRVYYRYQFVV